MKWDARLYDSNHQFVSAYGNDLIGLLQPEAGQKVLDLGCGTGDLCAALAKEDCIVLGLDASGAMIEKAKQKYPHLQFTCQSAAAFRLDQRFDAVFSNAVLHWIPEQQQAEVLKNVHSHLVPDGRFVAEMGAAGNVEKVCTTMKNVLRDRGWPKQAEAALWYFPTAAAYQQLLEDAGFDVEHIKTFNRPTVLAQEGQGLTNWLMMFGKGWFTLLPEREIAAIIEAVEERLRPEMFKDKTWIADYKRLRFVARAV